jgi:hypothetical protein
VNEQRARVLVAALNAAFPTPVMSDATFALYVAEVAKLADEQAAEEVVIGLIRTCTWLPRVAELHEAYRQTARTYADLREARHRDEAATFALTHGLPGPSGREPIPPEALAWLREHGVDVSGLIEPIDAVDDAAERDTP